MTRARAFRVRLAALIAGLADALGALLGGRAELVAPSRLVSGVTN